MPKVSVIIPVYNVEAYLDECMESIVNQTFRDIEIILVDDGSTDGSLELCRSYAQKDDRVRVFHQKNAGASSVRNVGIQNSRADWVMFVDGDDWMELDAIQTLYQKAMQGDYEMVVASIVCNFVGCEMQYSRGDSSEYTYCADSCRKYLLGAVLTTPKDVPDLFPKEFHSLAFLPGPCSKLYKRQFLEEHSIRFLVGVKKSEDRLFNLNVLARAKNVCFIDRWLYHYRQRQGSTCHSVSAGRYKLYLGFMEASKKFLTEMQLFREVEPYYYLNINYLMCDLTSLYSAGWNSCSSLKQFTFELRDFAENPLCQSALSCQELNGWGSKLNRIRRWFLRKKLYIPLMLLCRVYLLIFRRKSSEQLYEL